MQNHVQHNVDDNANVITRVSAYSIPLRIASLQVKQLHSALLAALYNRELLGERVYKVIEQVRFGFDCDVDESHQCIGREEDKGVA